MFIKYLIYIWDIYIVSAYYNISSKHSPAEYFEWITNFLSLLDCMVVFTTPDNANIFR